MHGYTLFPVCNFLSYPSIFDIGIFVAQYIYGLELNVPSYRTCRKCHHITLVELHE